jgi:hypothetical protein
MAYNVVRCAPPRKFIKIGIPPNSYRDMNVEGEVMRNYAVKNTGHCQLLLLGIFKHAQMSQNYDFTILYATAGFPTCRNIPPTQSAAHNADWKNIYRSCK